MTYVCVCVRASVCVSPNDEEEEEDDDDKRDEEDEEPPREEDSLVIDEDDDEEDDCDDEEWWGKGVATDTAQGGWGRVHVAKVVSRVLVVE